LGVEDVICYSYGKNGNSEAEISKKVAKTLGYPWYFVEYTSKRWNTCYHSEEMRAYERYAGNLTSVPHGQDYLAVTVLKTEGKIPENAVFVPGHTGDMISGGHIPRNIGEIPCDVDHLITQILMRHYVTGRLDNPDTQQLEGIFRERIRRSMGNREVFDSESLADGIEYFDFNERQAKKIVNSVRIYEFFGYEWRIPLWDSELMDFFLRTPLPWRLHQRLYKKYGFEKEFKGELAPLADIPCAKFETPSSLKRIVMSYFFKKIPSLETGAKNIISRYKVMSDPMNYHSILSKKNTVRFYLGNLDLESYIHQQYLSSVEKAEFANRSPES
jgi:asparagine synthase (glutamine-hydrolysing)